MGNTKSRDKNDINCHCKSIFNVSDPTYIFYKDNQECSEETTNVSNCSGKGETFAELKNQITYNHIKEGFQAYYKKCESKREVFNVILKPDFSPAYGEDNFMLEEKNCNSSVCTLCLQLTNTSALQDVCKSSSTENLYVCEKKIDQPFTTTAITNESATTQAYQSTIFNQSSTTSQFLSTRNPHQLFPTTAQQISSCSCNGAIALFVIAIVLLLFVIAIIYGKKKFGGKLRKKQTEQQTPNTDPRKCDEASKDATDVRVNMSPSNNGQFDAKINFENKTSQNTVKIKPDGSALFSTYAAVEDFTGTSISNSKEKVDFKADATVAIASAADSSSYATINNTTRKSANNTDTKTITSSERKVEEVSMQDIYNILKR